MTRPGRETPARRGYAVDPGRRSSARSRAPARPFAARTNAAGATTGATARDAASAPEREDRRLDRVQLQREALGGLRPRAVTEVSHVGRRGKLDGDPRRR